MYKAGALILPLLLSFALGGACSPVKAPAGDSGPGADADPNAPDAAPDAGPDPAKCGNGSPDPGESCDDGDNTTGDGCSAVCLDEAVFCDPRQAGTDLYSIGSEAGRMVGDGNYLYVAGNPGASNPVFRVLDVANPASVGESDFYQHADYPTARVRGLIKRGTRIWLAGSDPGLASLEVGNPSSVTLGAIDLNPATDGHLARIGNNHMLVSQSSSERPAVYDITGASPNYIGSLGDPGDVYYNVGTSATLGFASTKLKSVDLYSNASTPATASVVGRYDHATAWDEIDAVREIASEGNVLVLAVTHGTAGGIHIIDVGVPSAPVWKATIPEQPADIALVGRYLYFARSDGLRVYDLSDLASPTLAGSIVEFGFNGTTIAVDGERVYAIGEGKLMVALGLPGTCQAVCGNNKREYPEACDDGNHDEGDGCSADCTSL